MAETSRQMGASSASVEDFERRMELLAQVETGDGPGRWIVTPRKGARFVGPTERRRSRIRERRKRVFVFLLEGIGIYALLQFPSPWQSVFAWGNGTSTQQTETTTGTTLVGTSKYFAM